LGFGIVGCPLRGGCGCPKPACFGERLMKTAVAAALRAAGKFL